MIATYNDTTFQSALHGALGADKENLAKQAMLNHAMQLEADKKNPANNPFFKSVIALRGNLIIYKRQIQQLQQRVQEKLTKIAIARRLLTHEKTHSAAEVKTAAEAIIHDQDPELVDDFSKLNNLQIELSALHKDRQRLENEYSQEWLNEFGDQATEVAMQHADTMIEQAGKFQPENNVTVDLNAFEASMRESATREAAILSGQRAIQTMQDLNAMATEPVSSNPAPATESVRSAAPSNFKQSLTAAVAMYAATNTPGRTTDDVEQYVQKSIEAQRASGTLSAQEAADAGYPPELRGGRVQAAASFANQCQEHYEQYQNQIEGAANQATQVVGERFQPRFDAIDKRINQVETKLDRTIPHIEKRAEQINEENCKLDPVFRTPNPTSTQPTPGRTENKDNELETGTSPYQTPRPDNANKGPSKEG